MEVPVSQNGTWIPRGFTLTKCAFPAHVVLAKVSAGRIYRGPTSVLQDAVARRHSVTKGVTPALSSEDATALLAGTDVSTVVGLRDRAITPVVTYAVARLGAVRPDRLRIESHLGSRAFPENITE